MVTSDASVKGALLLGLTVSCVWLAAPLLGEERSAQQLMEDLQSRDPAVRRKAVRATLSVAQRDRGALRVLCLALEDRDATVRFAATQTLGRVCEKQKNLSLLFFPMIAETALKDRDPFVRAAAAQALGCKGVHRGVSYSPDYKTSMSKLVVPGLAKALRDKHYVVRILAAQALGRIEPNIAYSQDAESKKAIEVAASALAGALRDRSVKSPLREKALEAIRDTRGMPHQIRCVSGEWYEFGYRDVPGRKPVDGKTVPKQICYIRFEGPITDQSKPPKRIDSSAVRYPVVLYVECYCDPRVEAARALGDFHSQPKAAIPALSRAAKDKDSCVSHAASMALSRIRAKSERANGGGSK